VRDGGAPDNLSRARILLLDKTGCACAHRVVLAVPWTPGSGRSATAGAGMTVLVVLVQRVLEARSSSAPRTA
jgi:hypothetical protein